MDIDADLPLDTRDQQMRVLTAIVWEALRIYVDDTIGDEPWTTQPRDVTGLDTAIHALSEIREVRRAFPVRLRKPAKKTAKVTDEPPA
jgi:hypothetical protein